MMQTLFRLVLERAKVAVRFHRKRSSEIVGQRGSKAAVEFHRVERDESFYWGSARSDPVSLSF